MKRFVVCLGLVNLELAPYCSQYGRFNPAARLGIKRAHVALSLMWKIVSE